MLDAVDVGREVGDHDAAWGLAEDALEGAVQVALRARPSLALGVGRVTEQEQHPGVAQAAESLHVGGVAVGWRRVELEVARVDDASDRRVDGQRDRVRDRVAHGHRLDMKRTYLHRVADPDLAEVRLAQDAVLPQLRLDQTQR